MRWIYWNFSNRSVNEWAVFHHYIKFNKLNGSVYSKLFTDIQRHIPILKLYFAKTCSELGVWCDLFCSPHFTLAFVVECVVRLTCYFLCYGVHKSHLAVEEREGSWQQNRHTIRLMKLHLICINSKEDSGTIWTEVIFLQQILNWNLIQIYWVI